MLVRLSFDCATLTAALADLSAAEISEAAFELRQSALRLSQAPLEFVALEVDRRAAPGADELIVRLQPTDRLRSLLAAARTRDIE